ncbi:hypothetical protein HK099_004378 [Clydaea vesicula]|uniref:Increased recombination centers protein 6 n=1 Tax=Clydaea vesicula TaxID=447962 RepID=A0AAD5U0C6_9FUNG|nr:hypothetical protein HK099_004378 [Clydaea vesicula]
MSIKNRILYLGTEDSQHHGILESIIPNYAQSNHENKKTHCVPYQIDTKYYQAETVFWIDSISPSLKSDWDEDEEQMDEVCSAIDALILVFNGSNLESFKKLKPYSKLNDKYQPNIAMIIANFYDNSMETVKNNKLESELEIIRHWCIDNSFEFLNMNETLKADEVQDFGDEKFGFERIKECLESNIWEGSKNKDYKKKANKENNENLQVQNAAFLDYFNNQFNKLMMDSNSDNKFSDENLEFRRFENEDEIEDELFLFENIMSEITYAKENAARFTNEDSENLADRLSRLLAE